MTVSSFFRNYVQSEERTLLEDISRAEGGTDVSIEEGTEGLTDRLHCRFLVYQARTCPTANASGSGYDLLKQFNFHLAFHVTISERFAGVPDFLDP